MQNKESAPKQLILRQLLDDSTPEEDSILQRWREQDPSHQKIYDEICNSFDEQRNYSFPLTRSLSEAWHLLSQRIKETEKKTSPSLHPRRRSFWQIAATAAIFLLLGNLLHYFNATPPKSDMVFSMSVVAPPGQKAEAILADGTHIWLNSGSRLDYNTDFNRSRREVLLQGEGYFKVHTDSTKPFVVKTTAMDITAYGTSFNISAYPKDPNIKATLEEGIITLKRPHQSQEVPLKPGQQGSFNKEKQKLTQTPVNTDLYTSWRNNVLKFDNAVFSEVVKKLERWYDIKIHVEGKIAQTERYTMTIKTESLREVLNLICITTPITYKINIAQVYIKAKK